MVLEAAINGSADVLVTFNVKDYGETPGEFRIRVMRPAEALRKIQ
jgi:predicted nucleic acid-binding protein